MPTEEARNAPPGVEWKVQGFLAVAAGLLVLGLAFAQPASRPKREVTLTSLSVPLSATDLKLDRVGGLRFRSGLWLRSEDQGIGGFSGLTVEELGGELRIIAVTDQGDRMSGRLNLIEGGTSVLDHVTLEPLLGLEGRPVVGKALGDAESITRLPDGRILVGFERRHRIWAYGPGLSGPAVVFPAPPSPAAWPANGGLEALAAWTDGRVLAITEQAKTARGNFEAFLLQDGAWTALEWSGSAPGFEAADAAVLPDGDLLVLERYWSALEPTNIKSRIMRVKGDSVRPGAVLSGTLLAELQAPLIAENFEGLAAFRSGGVSRLLLVSDNNFNRAQRTLLLWFDLAD